MQAPSGKTGQTFDESEMFGPSKIDTRTGNLTLISPKLRWFWEWYPKWREAGRPTVGDPITNDTIGPIMKAKLPL